MTTGARASLTLFEYGSDAFGALIILFALITVATPAQSSGWIDIPSFDLRL